MVKAEEKNMEKTAFLMTNGCPENRIDVAETELFLVQNGWKIVQEADQADVILLNLCGLTNYMEKFSLDIVKRANEKKKANAILLVAGCLPKINKNSIQQIFNGDIIEGHNLKKISDLLEPEGIANGISANYLSPIKFLPLTNKSKVRRQIQIGIDLYRILYLFQRAAYRKYWEQINIVQPNTFYIKISNGCVHTCSYCAVKRSRGAIESKRLMQLKTSF